jgi:hypothetical protein
MKLSGPGKLGAIALVLMAGLLLYGRWTGIPFTLDLLHPNAIGGVINNAQAQRSAQASATDPGGGGHSMQSSMPGQQPGPGSAAVV